MTLGYVLSRYPLLSETFILREMWELERQGHRVRIYALRQAAAGVRHRRVGQLQARVVMTGWFNWRSQWRWLWRRPGAFVGTLAALLWHTRGDGNLRLGALAYWGKAVSIADRLERDGVEHVHAHFATHPAMAAWVAHRLTGIPYSFTVHAHDIFCHRAMLPQKVAAASAVVAISHYNQDLIEAMLPAPERAAAHQKIAVIHCGVETGQYAPLAAAPAVAAPAPGQPLQLLAVGSLQPYKGHRHLVDACARLHRQGFRFNCRIIGGGRLQAALQRQIRQLGLSAEVRLTGPADEEQVRAALAAADVLVMPSVVDARTGQMEGIPVALMEAMAAGRAVVASRLSGIPELIEDGREGLLVPPGDAVALAAAIARLLQPELRQQLGRAARRRVEQEFELRSNVRALTTCWGVPAVTPEPASKVAA